MVKNNVLSLLVLLISLFALKSKAAYNNLNYPRHEKSFLQSSNEISDEIAVARSTLRSRNDPIYDPKTKLCHFENRPEIRFTIDEYVEQVEAKKRADFYAALNSFGFEGEVEEEEELFDLIKLNQSNYYGTKHFISIRNEDGPFSNFGSPFKSPKNIDAIAARSSIFHGPSLSLFVPRQCIGFQRKWNFHLGSPGNLGDLIGWVSRIGYTPNIFKEFYVPAQKFYTLVPHSIRSPEGCSIAFHDLIYTEVVVQSYDIHWILFGVSASTDFTLFYNIHSVVLEMIDVDKIGIKFLFPRSDLNSLNTLKMRNLKFAFSHARDYYL